MRLIVVYYESIKRELNIKPIYECRCDERLQTKTKEFTCLSLSYVFLLSILKRLDNNPAPTECHKAYSVVGRNTDDSQTDIPGPPWVTSPWARQLSCHVRTDVT